jgi:hypothetical protein
MQLIAQASEWTNRTTRASLTKLAIGGAEVFVRMRVSIAMLPTPVTTVVVDVSETGEGWIPLKTFTRAGVPRFVGYGASAKGNLGGAAQGGAYGMDFIRIYENPAGSSPQSATSGGSQQIG